MPQPLCSHTFSTSYRCCSANRGQAAGVSKPPKGRTGERRRGQAAIWSGAGNRSGLSIPFSKEQHCLISCLHRRHLSLSSCLPGGVISRTNLHLQPLYLPTLPVEQFSITTVFTFPCLSLGELCNLLKPISPFLELQVPVGLSNMEKNRFLLLFHQRAVKSFTTWSFASLLSPQKMALELRLRADASAGTLGKTK